MSNRDERPQPQPGPQVPSATNPWAAMNAPPAPPQGPPPVPPQGRPPQYLPMGPTQQVATKKSPVGVLLAVIAVLLAAILAVLGWFYFSTQGSGGQNTTAAPQTVTTVAEAAGETLSTMVAPPSPTERDSSRITESITPPTSAAAVIGAEARADGVTARGWADNASVNCASGETLIYAARGEAAWVTVCSGGGSQTYRSDIFGGTLTAPVVPGQSNPATGYFTVNAAPATIVVRGAGLTVEQDGQVISAAALPVAWVFD